MIEPTDAVSATEEPEIVPNSVEAKMFTTARPPRIQPTSTLARLIRRTAIPPSAMIAPASTKNGIASSEKSSVPSEIFSMIASVGRSTQNAPMSEESPSENAIGTPIAHRMQNEPMRTSASMVYSIASGSSRYMIDVLGGSPHHIRSMMKSRSRTPHSGIGM